MASANAMCGQLTIPNGSNVSGWLNAHTVWDDAIVLSIFSPATLDAHTFVIELYYGTNPNDESSGVTGVTCVLNDGTNDVTLPAAGKVCQYPRFSAAAFRISDTTGNVAADRTFNIMKSYNPY